MVKFEMMLEWSVMQTTPWSYDFVQFLAAVAKQIIGTLLLGYFRQIWRSWAYPFRRIITLLHYCG